MSPPTRFACSVNIPEGNPEFVSTELFKLGPKERLFGKKLINILREGESCGQTAFRNKSTGLFIVKPLRAFHGESLRGGTEWQSFPPPLILTLFASSRPPHHQPPQLDSSRCWSFRKHFFGGRRNLSSRKPLAA